LVGSFYRNYLENLRYPLTVKIKRPLAPPFISDCTLPENSDVVTMDECTQKFNTLTYKLDRIDLALYGSNGRGGLVTDVSILLERKSSGDTLKMVFIGIGASICSSLITAYVLKFLI
jgi:hypothetical protein